MLPKIQSQAKMHGDSSVQYISDSADGKEESSSSFRYADQNGPGQLPGYRSSEKARMHPHLSSENLDINHEIDGTPFRLLQAGPGTSQTAGPETPYQQRLQNCDSTFYNHIFEAVESPESLRYERKRPRAHDTMKQSARSRNYCSTLVTEVNEDNLISNENAASKSDWFEPGIMAGSMTLDFRNTHTRSAIDPSKGSQSSPLQPSKYSKIKGTGFEHGNPELTMT